MLFFIYRIDKPGAVELRAANRPAHLEYAKSLGSRLRLAGPTLDEAGETMNGSVFILEAADRADAEAITAEDPYEKADLFESKIIRPYMEVQPWGLAAETASGEG